MSKTGADSKKVASDAGEKKNEDPQPMDPDLIEEDDEFEEFPVEDWAEVGEEDEEEDDVNVWEDNWDDDSVEDDFSKQLRAVLEKRKIGQTVKTG